MGKNKDGEGSLTRLKDGKLRLRITLNGITKSFIGTDKKELEKRMEKWKLTQGVLPTDLTFQLAFENYILAKEHNWKLSTRERTLCYWNNHIKKESALCRTKITSITSEQLQAIANRLLNENSVTNVKSIFRYINQVLNFYQRRGNISFNPCKSVIIEKRLTIRSREEKQSKHLNNTQQELFLEELKKYPLSIQCLLGLGLLQGLRLSEAQGLTIKDIDFVKNEIFINKSCKYSLIDQNGERKYIHLFQPPKNASSDRDVRINPLLKPILEARIEQIEARKKRLGKLYFKDKDFGYLIVAGDTGLQLNPARGNATVKQICKRLNLPTLKFHDLRHSYATKLVTSNKVSLALIAKILGHSNTNMLSKIYAHLDNDDIGHVLDEIFTT